MAAIIALFKMVTNMNAHKFILSLAAVAFTATPLIAAPIKPKTGVAPTQIQLDFQAASAAFQKQDIPTLNNLRAKFSGHLLESYVQYWWLTAQLTQGAVFAQDTLGQIKKFTQRFPDSPLSDLLRRDQLRSLGRQGEWQQFIDEFPRLQQEDTEVSCLNWQRKLLLNPQDRTMLADVKVWWTSEKVGADACYAATKMLANNGAFPAQKEVWQRVHALLNNNATTDARKTASVLKSEAQAERFSRQLDGAMGDASGYLARQKGAISAPEQVAATMYALQRHSRVKLEPAVAWMTKASGQFSDADTAQGWADLGLAAAMQHDPRAVGFYKRAKATDLSDTQAGWKVRASLRVLDWDGVLAGIAAMTALEQRESAWRYWQARAHVALNQAAKAQPLFEDLAKENNFYGLLAAEQVGRMPSPTWHAHAHAKTDVEAIAARANVQRALQLYYWEYKAEALREWAFAMRGLSDVEIHAAADYAVAMQAPDRAIAAAERTATVHNFAQRFPIPHRTLLQPLAQKYSMEEAWVYGLIRQESRFMQEVKSRVGAMGLMQLMPATATWAAKQAAVPNFTLARTVDVDVNLKLGIFYLRHVLDDLGHPILATAAYNAGPGRARRWRGEAPMEGAIYAESIPFNETRDYVKKVFANQWFYANRLAQGANGAPTVLSIKRMVGTVPGRSGAGTSALVEVEIPATVAASAAASVASAAIALK